MIGIDSGIDIGSVTVVVGDDDDEEEEEDEAR